MTYFTRSRVLRPTLRTRAVQALVARAGEPWRWGWHPDELPAYLAARGWSLARDVTMSEASHALLPPALAKIVVGTDRRIAVATAGTPESIAISNRA
jgi:lambda repressor-like predicted transcriptional regulator